MKISLSPNPVLVKELRGRMRGPRAYVFLTGTLALLGVVSYGLYRIAVFSVQTFSGGPPGAIIGQLVFSGLVFLALLVICAVAPALTASAISSEHERKTFDMLMATPLRPASILLGKLTASLSYTALLILAAVPLVSLSYVFGGVSTTDMLQAFLLLIGFALTYSVIGLFFSALLHRTGAATVASYIVLAVFVVGSFFAYIVVGVTRQSTPPNWVLALNPFSALASALANGYAPGASSGLMSLLLGIGGGTIDPRAPVPQPLWRYTAGIYAWLTVTLYLISMQLVKPVHRFRFGVRGWAVMVMYVVVSAVAVPVVYGPLPPNRIAAWMRWNTSPKRDMVVNGNFTENLAPTWQVSAESEHTFESGGEVNLTAEGGRQVASFSRSGTGHGETRLTQVISQSIPRDGWLQMHVVLRVQSQDLAVCGVQGSECPVTVKVEYEDVGGGKHEWARGFYAEGNPATSELPPLCITCESRQAHIRVPANRWYTFESPNLLEEEPWRIVSPRIIRSITVSAAGHSYKSQVAEVALFVREGRPPNWGNAPDSMGTPTPVFVGPGMMIQKGIVVPVEPPVPPPTAAPVEPAP